MRFYELQYNLVAYSEWTEGMQFDFKQQWFTSRRKAVRFRQDLYLAGKLSGPKNESMIFEHEIPTNREGLLEWLNTQGVALMKRRDGGFS